MRNVKVAAIQMACSIHTPDNLQTAERLVRQAASNGAQMILLQELFETPYFCKKEKLEYYKFASVVSDNEAIQRFQEIAKELQVVVPISFYEKKHNARYNSVAVIDADGRMLGVYRKSHIPDGPGYEEKFFFNHGDTGFKVWDTKYGSIGVGICWDQWFPEAARIMALQGAELLLYPTAIGSEPDGSGTNSKEHWQRCIQGHAAANIVPVIVANRIGIEMEEDVEIDFYGSSFITDATGHILVEASNNKEDIIYAEFDLDAMEVQRMDWSVFRDRRPELYHPLVTLDGTQRMGGNQNESL